MALALSYLFTLLQKSELKIDWEISNC